MVVCIVLFDKAILRFSKFLTGVRYSDVPLLFSLFVNSFLKLLISKKFMKMVNGCELINHKYQI